MAWNIPLQHPPQPRSQHRTWPCTTSSGRPPAARTSSPTVTRLEARIVEQFAELSGRAVDFLVGEEALRPYHTEIDELITRAEAIEKATEAAPIRQALGAIGDGMELLTEVIARAILEARRKELLSTEGVAEFGAQFKPFSQAVSGALGLAETPEKCDEQLSKLML
ncbi:MAG: hypothetical protein GY856_00420, partial [bacterium]|nr:hypothetical protein [bacterium]